MKLATRALMSTVKKRRSQNMMFDVPTRQLASVQSCGGVHRPWMRTFVAVVEGELKVNVASKSLTVPKCVRHVSSGIA